MDKNKVNLYYKAIKHSYDRFYSKYSDPTGPRKTWHGGHMKKAMYKKWILKLKDGLIQRQREKVGY